MRYLLMLAFGAFLVMPAQGDSTRSWSSRSEAKPDNPAATPAYDTREGGEDVSTAIEIPGDVSLLPFHDIGETCDNADDYDEVCVSSSSAPDVVYRFTPSEDIVITIDLCASGYDTKLVVYDESMNVVACNEDAGCGASGSRSVVFNLPVAAGETHYIVVDGEGTECGPYDLLLTGAACAVMCLPGAMVEGEPGCHDDYHDGYDGGCDGTGWLPIAGNEQGCAAVCGTGCTYFQNGWSYRDTDWYEATAAGGPVTVSCEAEFPVLALLHWSASCEAWGYEYASAAPCHPAVVSWPIFPAGGEVWITVMPSVYSGVSESEYVFTVCGLAAGPTPVEETSWGQIKRRYRDSTRK